MITKNAAYRGTAPTQDAFDLAAHAHCVQFYSNDEFLLDGLSRFIGYAIGAGDAGIVIATQIHRDGLANRLLARGLDLTRVAGEGRYVSLDAAEALAQFMVDGWPDEQRFVEFLGGVITRTRQVIPAEHGRAVLFGEMVALLWADGNTEAALRLEQLWNQLAQSHSFSLVCAYPLRSFYRQEQTDPFQRICAEHSAVIPAESYILATEEQRLRSVAQWQQKAQALESEVEQRKQTEVDARKLAAIVESSDDAIASKDLNGIVTSWNASAERIFGYKAEEMVGQPMTMIIPLELQDDERRILEKIRRGERIEHFETVRVTKSGRRID